MISILKKELLKEINKLTGVSVSIQDIKQGVKYPCFFCEYITSKIKTVAQIDVMNVIDYDVIYFPKDTKEIEEVVGILSKIKSILVDGKIINIEVMGVDVVDDVLHYQVRLYSVLEALQEPVPTLDSIKLIKSKLEQITHKKAFYINANLNEIKNGFFTIEPSTTVTNNISITGAKEYEREIVIRYTTSELNLDIYGFLENTLDELLKAIKGKNGMYKINYSIDLSYEKEEYEELNITNHETVLTIIERK